MNKDDVLKIIDGMRNEVVRLGSDKEWAKKKCIKNL